MEQDGAKQRSLEQRGKVQSSAGKSGAMWRSVGRYEEVVMDQIAKTIQKIPDAPKCSGTLRDALNIM